MANSKQAIKRAHQNKKRALQNASQRSEVRTAVKKMLELCKKGEKETASKAFQKTISLIDKVARRGIIHKNKAARLKSRIVKKLQAQA